MDENSDDENSSNKHNKKPKDSSGGTYNDGMDYVIHD